MSSGFHFLININILLLLSFLGYKVLFYFKDSSVKSVRKTFLLNCARSVLLISLVLPAIVFNLKLDKDLPSIEYSQFNVLPEGISQPLVTKNQFQKEKLLFESSAGPKSSPHNIYRYLWMFLLIGLGISIIKLIDSLFELNRLLSSSVQVRKFKNYKLYISHLIDTPFTYYSFKGAVVVIPDSLIADKANFYLSLSHENQHIRQRDIHWSLALEFVKCFFWYNPAIYLWNTLLKDLSELACDERVLERGRVDLFEYGNCLVDVAESALNSKNYYVVGAAMAGNYHSNKSFLLRRIEMLKTKNTLKSNSTKFTAKAAMLFSILISLSVLTRVQASFSKITTHPDIQKIVEKTLKKGMGKASAKRGFAIVANPNTGEIVGLSHLELVNHEFRELSAENFLKQTYEPYSHIKPMIAAIALEKGNMHEQTILDARGGKVVIGGESFHDWKDHGKISLTNTIANSSFVGTYRIAESIRESDLVAGLNNFGFDKGSSVEGLPFAKRGKIYLGTGERSKYNLAFLSNGIGAIKVSPLEVLQAYSSIANGGKLLKPVAFGNGSVKPELIRNTIGHETASRMKDILLRTMTQGTGKWSQSSSYTIAGKTASGFVSKAISSDDKHAKADRGLFIGFAPFKSPKLIAFVIIDHPKGPAHGSKHAAPLVRSILNLSLKKMSVKVDHRSSSN
ncbi:MAG: hypothetical protein HOE90_01630 [Bacteriovoracaceae bacterium]|jgi:beta-lactamase regulating signal transducer with metallopeptidase domain|nr:hypothetical protein [Bacteriovoracaceae bacterium]